MTRDDVYREMKELRERDHDLKGKIVKAARPVIPVLLDAGRSNSAKELQELFFEYDAHSEAMSKFFLANGAAVIDVIAESLKRGNG